MVVTRAGFRATLLFGFLAPSLAIAEDQVRTGNAPDNVRTERSPAPAKTEQSSPLLPTMTGISDPTVLRTETSERLKRLSSPGDKDAKDLAPDDRALRELLQERLDWLKSWEAAVQARQKAEDPKPSPERQAADLKDDQERVKAALEQALKAPDSLIPACFRTPPPQVTDALRTEMKEAIESAQNDLKDWSARIETLRNDPAQPENGPLSTLRAARDKIHQRVVTLKARRGEREAVLTAAKTAEARDLARERLINFEWEARVEQERLRGIEARMALEAKLADLTGLKLQVFEAHVLLAKKSLTRMEERFKAVVDRAERALKQEAATEQNRAAQTVDPMERFRARRKAHLLELKAQIVKCEDSIGAMTTAVERQAGLADRAEKDFANIKKLLDDGRVSHLDALRLNNDFRRIGPERDRISKTELTQVVSQLAYYENALSAVEIALINDSRDDRYEFDTLLERAPPSRHGEANKLFEEVESEHAKLLERNRLVLGTLASLAEQSHDQVERRLRILDDQYGFIRTHIFWVRDQEAVSTSILWQCQREVFHLGKALTHLVLEMGDRSLWGRTSPEFVLGVLSLLVLPVPLHRVRKRLESVRRSGTIGSP